MKDRIELWPQRQHLSVVSSFRACDTDGILSAILLLLLPQPVMLPLVARRAL
jgi:hypothetical protein